MVSGSERMIRHTGTETRTRLLREAAVRNIAMGATLTQRRRVDDEGLRVVKSCQMGRSVSWLISVVFDGTIKGSTG